MGHAIGRRMTGRADDAVRAPTGPGRGAAYWTGLLVGIGVLGYGVAGLLTHASLSRAAKAAIWLVGADLVHDLLFAPAVFAAGWLVARFVPRRLRAPIDAGLA